MVLCINTFPENDVIYDQVSIATIVQGKQKQTYHIRYPILEDTV